MFAFALLGCLLAVSSGQAAILQQVDDFQSDVTTLGWGGFKEFLTGPPARWGGGQFGFGDFYLAQSTFGYHMATRNSGQWSGDYLTAGIRTIELDANHITGSEPVALRIGLVGPGGFFSSIDPTPIDPGLWNHYVFGLTGSDLVHVDGGTGNLADTLSAVEKLMLRHDPAITPTGRGAHPEHITGTVGFDNITATPEPATLSLLALGGLTLLRQKRRRGRRSAA
jgi:hypothetical protein